MTNTRTLLSLGILLSSLVCYTGAVAADTTPEAPHKKKIPKVKPVTELQKTDIVLGTGDLAYKGKTVSITYTSWLYSFFKPDHKGMQFATGSSTFEIGKDTVIKGWDQGISGMKVGGKRVLIIPSDLAYGKQGMGRGTVPPNYPLVSEVELKAVK